MGRILCLRKFRKSKIGPRKIFIKRVNIKIYSVSYLKSELSNLLKQWTQCNSRCVKRMWVSLSVFLISFENSYPKKKKKGLGKIGFKIFFPSLNNMGNLAFRWSRIRPLASSQSCCSALLCVCWVFLTEPLPSWEQRWQAVPEKGVNISSSNYWKSWEYSIYCVIK